MATAKADLLGYVNHMASGLATAVTTLRSQQKRPGRASWLRRALFNMGMFAISTTLAGQVYLWMGGSVGQVAQVSNLAPIVACGTAGVLANLAILVGVLILQSGRSPLAIWRHDVQWGVPISLLGSIVGGGGLALAYEMFGLLGLAVFFLPVTSTSYSYRLYVAHTKG